MKKNLSKYCSLLLAVILLVVSIIIYANKADKNSLNNYGKQIQRQANGYTQPVRYTPPFDEQEFIEAQNSYRISKGLVPLVRDDRLDKVAQAHAEDMKNRGYYDHTDPDGVTPPQRIYQAIGYEVYAGENQDETCSTATPKSEMFRFTNSEGHNANILDQKINAVGIGYVRSEVNKCNGFLVIEFARL